MTGIIQGAVNRPSRTCEVLTAGRQLCGKPTTHAYPAMGGGYMALCSEHAKKHPEAWPMQEIDDLENEL